MKHGVAAFAVAAAVCSSLALISGCAKSPEIYAPPEYVSWRATTDVVLNYPIPGHMNRFRLPRMNDLGFSAVPKTVGGKLHWDFPEDTVIVKEVYATSKPGPGDKPIQLTIMAKDPGDRRALGGWLWYTKVLPDGKETLFPGNYCITCHANANEQHPYGDGNPNEEFRDYVYFVPGEKPPMPGPHPEATGKGR
jgi:hypothetical protein